MSKAIHSSIALTQDIQVIVHSKYDQESSKLSDGQFLYVYHVVIKNKGEITVTLMNRYWHITDGLGRVHEVNGEGVIGQCPTIHPGEKFEYSSFCPLETQYGVMKGHYEMVTEGDETIVVEVAPFCLSVPGALN